MARQFKGEERRTEKVHLRVSPSAKAKLQAAASASHRSLSDFIMVSALSKAEEILADRQIFTLGPKKWAEFQAALDSPTRSLPRLNALLKKPVFFVSGAGE